MNTFPDEFRLLLIVLLNGGVFAAAYRFARRSGEGGTLQAICDAFLIYFLVQYAAVGLPGVCGVLNGWSLCLVAAVAVILLVIGAWRGGGNRLPSTLPQRWGADHFGLLGCALFTGGYIFAYAYFERFVPPVATDSLVYHLPTAVQWIQTGRLGIYPTWYWNPAASYSPGTGSMFMAWWMLPAGNEVFVRFVQIPPLLLIFFLVVRMCRLMGCGRTVAGLVATAATLCRPLFSEAMFQKDDLYVTAFIAAAVLALSREPAREKLGPWRAGVALGFVLASKYTALLACPVFLFLIDSPFRARWKARHWAIAAGLVLLMAAPWYVRNILLTGNPLYPVDVRLPGLHFQGLFGTERDQQLRTAGGVWKMLSETYHSLPLPLIVLLAAGWLWTCITSGRRLLRDPLPRACVIGSVVTLALFLITSPHHEVRYVFPLIVLWFAASGLALAHTPARFALVAAAVLAMLSTATSFAVTRDISLAELVGALAGAALVIAAAGVGAAFAQARVFQLKARGLVIVAATVATAGAMFLYINWSAYVGQCRQARYEVWLRSDLYPDHAPTWKWVGEQLPPDATIAYANTYFVYPYYGFDYTRRVGYAPVRRGLHNFLHFPRLGDRVSGDLIVERMTQVMDTDPEVATWRENLRAMGAQYLVVFKSDPHLNVDPPELRFAQAEPKRFVPVFEDAQAVVFRID
ncbi:MAG: Dolichyl-phosphate-mannose-protein mannosyltransferase [Phycisphaerales bacterium]|nr:Dolichyl-phosphate-mannose-protein mannosyltransferase [Phycisphaerales bacterium]